MVTSADRRSLSERLKAQAYGLGFDLAGIAELGEPATRDRFDAWLAAGHHGEMAYLDGDGAELRRDARRPHVGATHALVVAMSYGGREPSGPIARYARGDDYHELLRERVRQLHHWLERETGKTINARPYVDSGPILERDLARRAGLGWFGKNTLLISPRIGSFFFLASLFVEFPLEPDAPFEADRCGTCTRCLDACPTDAFAGPRDLDASKCISYLTIELKGDIPEHLRQAMGALVFGCDICQEVCPWNVTFTTELREPAFASREMFLDAGSREGTRALAREILTMDAADYAAAFKGGAIKRAKLWMLKRNACVVLGNIGTTDDVSVLEAMLAHEHEVVREQAAWAMAQVQQRRLQLHRQAE
ncbi:MAG: tRNA epoxyqueuosine(34) reductase QueG [Gemmatimonadaceae bacterium]|nr:tRNA epoxyqueuosine(34) reductase QueG [Gemmatimonadaceae bacterium]